MDRREALPLSGSGSYYMQRGMAGSGSGLQGSSGYPSPAFQANIGGSSIGSTLPVEPVSAISPPRINAGAPLAGLAPASESLKRKRGRPRKYGVDGSVSLALSPSTSTPTVSTTPTQKRGRGRPPGSGRKRQLASLGGWISGSAGMGFTPHVITIAIGEDITSRITSFSQQGPRAICILSANGAICTATLRQPSISGGTVTYEGHFEILCLSGCYLPTDNSGSRGRTGSLSVSLASSDGRVIGGGVGGVLIAASPIQVIAGSFLCSGSKTKSKAGESREVAADLDRQTVDSPVTPAANQPNQNLSLNSSMGAWPSSRSLDLQNADVDIDLMRG